MPEINPPAQVSRRRAALALDSRRVLEAARRWRRRGPRHARVDADFCVPGSEINDSAAFGRFAPGGATRRILSITGRCPPSWAGKRRAFFLRGLALMGLRGQPLDVEVLGARMRLHARSNIWEKRILFTPQFFDPLEREIIAPFLSGDCVFVDVGANFGGYALWAAGLAGPGSRILAIEPEPAVFERLCFNIRANRTGTVKALRTAVADREGRLRLFYDQRNHGGASICISRNAPAGGDEVEVPATTLLDLLARENIERVDVLKVDVAGAEDLVIGPFCEAAPRALMPAIVILSRQRNHWSVDVAALLRGKGYAARAETASNLVYTRERAPAPGRAS